MFSELGKVVVISGIVLIIVGLFISSSGKANISQWFHWFGHLPFDIAIERENFKFYFPLGSMMILSIVMSLLLQLYNRFIR